MIPVKYNLRSLGNRKTTTFATALGIGLVVFVFASVLMLSTGIHRALSTSGKPDIAIVIRKGSDAELSSAIELQNVGLVLAPRQVARSANGQPDGVGEVAVFMNADKIGGDGVSNLQVRGVPDNVWDFRPDVRIIEGRKPRPGADECVVGRAVRGRFKGLELGQSIALKKNRPLTTVGVMESGGSSFESEIWADVDVVRSAFGLEGYVQSVRARLSSPAEFDAYKQAIEQNRQLSLQVERESTYYEKQSEGTSAFIVGMGGAIALFFSVGAMIGAMITMYSAVSNRRREIGTLRALGFGKLSIMTSFLLESVFLALLGGGLGALASCAMGLVHFSVVNFQSWSEMIFSFRPTLPIVGGSLLVAGLMGVLGGLFPAVRAARLPLIKALKN
jgi:putative ABC transport system permease protein